VAVIIDEWPGQWAIAGGMIVVSTITLWSLLKIKSGQAGVAKQQPEQ
jgi:hypothetical protein